MGGPWRGDLRVCRFPMSPARQPCFAPAHPFGDGSGISADIGGRTMRQFLFARTGQPQTQTQTHPLFARAGAAAADLWLNLPLLTMADFRDLRFRNLLSGLTHDVDDDA